MNGGLRQMLKDIRTYLNDCNLDDPDDTMGALTVTLAFIAVECRRDAKFFGLVDGMVVGAGHDGFRERLGRCKTATDGGGPGTGENA